MASADTKAEILKFKSEIAPALKRLAELECKLRSDLSKEWICANGVRLSDVERVNDKTGWFGTIQPWAGWIRKHSTKRFAEWDGRVYYTSELTGGHCSLDSPALLEDVPA